MKRLFVLPILLLLLLTIPKVDTLAQTDPATPVTPINGIVMDSTTGIPAFGVIIQIQSRMNLSAMADENGFFQMSKCPVGEQVLIFTGSTYKSKTVAITVVAGKVNVLDTIWVVDQVRNITLRATVRKTDSEKAAVAETRESKEIVNVMSQAQIQKGQDRDAAQVLQRVPGVTIMDGRFLRVRGLPERYNNVMLNGAIAPSTEVDKKAFAFDLIPSPAIDRIVVYKSGSGELPGDFAGSVVKLYTRNVPVSNQSNFSFSLSYRLGTTFNTFDFNKGPFTDVLGMDFGRRKLPSSFPSNLSNVNSAQNEQAGKSLNNNYNVNSLMPMPDIRFSYNLARRFKMKKGEGGTINSLSYTFTSEYNKRTLNRYLDFDPKEGKSPYQSFYTDLNLQRQARIGLVSNWWWKPGKKSEYWFKNFYSQIGNNQTTIRTGQNVIQRPTDEFKNYAFWYMQRSIVSSQISGKHIMKDSPDEVTWTTGVSYVGRTEPDYRRSRSVRPIGSTGPYQNIIPPGATTFDAARFYSWLKEITVMGTGQYVHSFGVKDSSLSLTAGAYVEHKARDFQARWMSYVYPSFNNPVIGDSLSYLPIDQIFDPNNVSAVNGYRLEEGTNKTDAYTGKNTLLAGYANFYIPYKKFKIAVGSRAEYNHQILLSELNNGEKVNVDHPIFSLLPFLNVGYNVKKNNILRVAYSRTVNRPDFRELAPFLYYDFAMNFDYVGNPNLKTAAIHNVDLRYEIYPSDEEMITFALFYKNFTNAIENYVQIGADNPIYTFRNAPTANVLGGEIEVRRSLKGISAKKLISNTTLVLNASYIYSEVDLGSSALAQDRFRPMQGQSPYILNFGLYHSDEDKGFNWSIIYNVLGARIYAVGDDINPTIYEMPRNSLDISFSKRMNDSWEFRFGVQDVLNAKYRFIQDSDRNGKITSIDESILEYRRGSYFTVGINYNILGKKEKK